MKIKKNDTVYVVAGKDKKSTGKVLSVDTEANMIKVEGVCVQRKHRKARKAGETSGIVSQVGSINASNVLIVCPACGKNTRVGYVVDGDKKVRVCKKCGASLDVKPEAKKRAKKAAAATKTAAKTTAKKTSTKKTAGEKTADAPKKTTRKTAAKKAAEDKAE
mgnify:FL=1